MKRNPSNILFALAMLTACTAVPKAKTDSKKVTLWLKVGQDLNEKIQTLGLPWFSENHRFARLPEKIKVDINKSNPEAWTESLCPSGARVRFKTDSPLIAIRALHGNDRISLPHMSSFGTAGMDLYEGTPDQQTYRGTSKPRSGTLPYEHLFFENLPKKMREWTLYLPTYSNLTSLEIGVDPHSNLSEPTPYRIKKPIVFYGTSITQSCCATRGSN